MTVLVVGATGFIGAEVTRINRVAGHHVIACGRKAWEGKIRKQFPDGEDYWSTEKGAVPNSLLHKADCMVLLAAKRPYQGFSFADYADNVTLAYRYMMLAMENGLKNIVFASSKAVYSGRDMPWREEISCAPSSLYGASKVAVEQLGAYFSAIGKLCFKSLRFAQVIGDGERKGYLINTLIDNAREKRTQIIYGSGEQRRQYVYVKDVADAVLRAEECSTISGAFNIGMEGNVSNLELAEIVNECFGNTGNLVHDYSRPMIGSDDEMSIEKAKKELGFCASFDIWDVFSDLAGRTVPEKRSAH